MKDELVRGKKGRKAELTYSVRRSFAICGVIVIEPSPS
jgi:hypothetical protein